MGTCSSWSGSLVMLILPTRGQSNSAEAQKEQASNLAEKVAQIGSPRPEHKTVHIGRVPTGSRSGSSC